MSPGKFAFTASDQYIGVINAFLDFGWKPLKLFTAPITGHMASNNRVIELAQSHGIPIQLSKMDENDMIQLQDEGCELLVLGSYQWRVGNWSKYLPRAINFHPAPLPSYRGPYPLVQGILDRRSVWATTCHKVAAELDTGDVLATRYFALGATECHESLSLKAQIETQQLARFVAKDIESLWESACPQGDGTYVPMWSDVDRTIDFKCTIEVIELKLRAFGNFECLANVNGMRHYVRRAVCWLVDHECEPGTLVHADGSRYVVACKDGCVALLDWSLVPPGTRIMSLVR